MDKENRRQSPRDRRRKRREQHRTVCACTMLDAIARLRTGVAQLTERVTNTAVVLEVTDVAINALDRRLETLEKRAGRVDIPAAMQGYEERLPAIEGYPSMAEAVKDAEDPPGDHDNPTKGAPAEGACVPTSTEECQACEDQSCPWWAHLAPREKRQ